MSQDVIVIGAGQAGVPLARRLAASGKQVLLVERAELGGTCVNTGCTPTKTMIASARAAHVARTATRLGVRAGPVTVDFPAVVARKDAVVERWRKGLRTGLEAAGVRVVRGHARFAGERTVEVGGARETAELVVVNAGARPVVPAVPGLDGVAWLDNRRVMELRELPAHLVVLGGGYIGCELGQAFRRYGSQVTIVDHNPHLLPREDEDVSAALEGAFRAEGIALELSAEVEGVEGAPRGAPGVRLRLRGGREVRGSHLLVATGRRANTDDLGCEAAGIALDSRGFIRVDDRYRTSAPGVYAVGDVTGGPQFTHSSWDDHRLLLDLLAGRSERGRSSRLVPYAVFTDPQVAGVGLSEKEARARGVAHEVATMPFGHVARAIEIDETAGTMKVLVDPATERILGAFLVGAEAGELIHVFAALMRAGAPARVVAEAEFVHPTFAEGLQTLVMRLPRYALG
ncbi:MAG TPA: mercuric reductase [Anaeromyxobacteraceae bacterium]|nr:mercuric reductase [Anaeromyxobacteraceae bacterium]